MQLTAVLLLLPAVAFGLAVPDKVQVAAANPTPKPPGGGGGSGTTWVVDVWPGASCAKGAPTTGPAQPLKDTVAAGSGCLETTVTFGSAMIKNAAGCTFVFYDDAQCTVANPLQSTKANTCVNFTGTKPVTIGVTCP